MEIPIQAIKKLRDETGAGIMDCKRALSEADSSFSQATTILKERGLALAEKKASRETSQGLVEAYIHTGGRIGTIVEVNCETDFVAKTPKFKRLAHDLAMQVAAMNPKFISPDETEGEDGSEFCLLSQPFIKDPQKNVQDIIIEAISELRENIRVRRFTRFELGD